MPSAARVARNEDLFREVNEEIKSLEDTFSVHDLIQFVCECSTIGCREQVPLRGDEYGAVRDDDTHFLVTPGHVTPEHERVVAKADRYWVVEKFGFAGEVAEATAE